MNTLAKIKAASAAVDTFMDNAIGTVGAVIFYALMASGPWLLLGFIVLLLAKN